VNNLSDHHQRFLSLAGGHTRMTGATQSMLRHVESQFQTVSLRLKSLDKRMQNIIALSVHLVNQEGNSIMQSDNDSMTTIVFVTLVFLPISTVSVCYLPFLFFLQFGWLGLVLTRIKLEILPDDLW